MPEHTRERQLSGASLWGRVLVLLTNSKLGRKDLLKILSIMTLSILTLGIMKLCIVTLSIMTLNIVINKMQDSA